MSKLYIRTVILALLALMVVPAMALPDLQPTTNAGNPTTGDGFGATLEVALEVEEYADVTWDVPSFSVTLSGPADWEKGVNWELVPLHINSNCNVLLEVYEGLSDWVADQGIPVEGIWGQAFDGNYDHLIYASNLQLLKADYQSSSQPWGACYDYGTSTNSPDAGHGVALPDGSGTGSMGEAYLDYGGLATGPQGPAGGAPSYDGHLAIPVAVGIVAQAGSYSGQDWTNIAAGAAGTPLVYAVISSLP